MRPKTEISTGTGIIYAEPEQRQMAEKLAAQLCLPLAAEGEHYDFILCCTELGLELYRPGDQRLTGSIRVDFVHGTAGYRRIHGGSEMLIRAIGHKKHMSTSVLDATGGLGQDTFIMASYGCHVHITEKNQVVAALLEDGLRRAAVHPHTKKVCGRIRLTVGDSYQLLTPENRTDIYDVIYLDPMFPKRSKSALVKKELQILQLLVGNESGTDLLFASAINKAAKRVVVKRPKNAAPLQGRPPSHSLGGKTTRYDVYLTG